MEAFIAFLKDNGHYGFVVLVVLYFITGRRANVERKKAVALVYHALFFFGLSATALLIDEYQLSPHLIWITVAAVLGVVVTFRSRVFPYRKNCQKCGAIIQWKYRWIEKDNDCIACRATAPTEALG